MPDPVPSGPSATEIRLQKEADDLKISDKKKKDEEAAQRAKNKRGRRSLLSEENTGAGFFVGPASGGGY